MKPATQYPTAPIPMVLAIGLSCLIPKLSADEYIAYDGSGNIAAHRVDSETATLSYDGGNRLVGMIEGREDRKFSYDAAGALVAERSGENAEAVEYEYEYGSRLSRRLEGDDEVEVLYDYRGYPVAKQVGGEITPWVWEGARMVAVGNEPKQPELAVRDFLGTDLDREGSVFGGSERGALTGKHYDEDLEAYVFPYRFYRPDLMRWTTPDPVGYPDGFSSYAYSSSPVNEFDPFGLDVWSNTESKDLDFQPKADAITDAVIANLKGEIDLWLSEHDSDDTVSEWIADGSKTILFGKIDSDIAPKIKNAINKKFQFEINADCTASFDDDNEKYDLSNPNIETATEFSPTVNFSITVDGFGLAETGSFSIEGQIIQDQFENDSQTQTVDSPPGTVKGAAKVEVTRDASITIGLLNGGVSGNSGWHYLTGVSSI